MTGFDYEKKIWGVEPVTLSPFCIQALKLRYVLSDLAGVTGKVLEIGCGAGNMAKAIKRYRPDLGISAVDISRTAITLAKQESSDVSFRESGAEKLPFGDGSFSAVLLFDVLEHVASPDVVLNELYRVLRPGGVLHIFSPLDKQPMTMHWLLYSLGWKAKDRYTGHVHWFSDRSFRTLLDTHGFVLQKKRFSFHQILSLFDIIYYSFQAVLGMSAPDGTLAGRLRRKRSGWAFLLFLFYQLIVAVGFYESRFLWWFPWATGGHYMSIKRQK